MRIMIDTVVLSVPMTPKVVIRGGMAGWDMVRRNKGGELFVKNNAAASGLYLPRVASYHRRAGNKQWNTHLRIEFSVPKLIYGDNLNELVDAQFDAVIEALRERLEHLGVSMPTPMLRGAEVRVLHYSKNFTLTAGYSASFVIGELTKVNLNKHFDLTRVKYIEGESVNFYTSAHSFIAYDKVAEISNARKFTPEKERLMKQIELLRQHPDGFEVLRLEVRLSRYYKLQSLFKTLGYPPHPTFADVFSTAKSQAVLMHYWQTLVAKNGLALFAPAIGAKEILKQVAQVRPNATGSALMRSTGMLLLAADGKGMRELRTILAPRINSRTWHRIAKEWRGLSKDLVMLQPRAWYGQVVEQLGRYPPLRLDALLQK